MFTPQEIQEKTFVKAVFGGYDMQTVDEFLEPLTQDYITLYRENAVLKSKMKVLVEKLEEYRAQEQSMRKAIITAQRTADSMIAEAEKKAAKLMNDAQTSAQAVVPVVDTAEVNARAEAAAAEAEAAIRQETERMNNAKRTALNFIEVLEQDIRGHLELLEKLKQEDLALEEVPAAEPVRPKPFDFEAAEEKPLVVPKAEPVAEPPAQTTEDIANEIEQNITRLMDLEEPVENPKVTTDATIKFTNLQFGRNYDPTSN